MSIANFPFPSFTLLLTTDRVIIPGPSYVFRLAPLEEVPFPSMTPGHVAGYFEEANLVDLSFEDDYVTDVAYHPSYTDTISTGSGHTTEDDSTKKPFPFVKMRRSARLHLKNIFKLLSQKSDN